MTNKNSGARAYGILAASLIAVSLIFPLNSYSTNKPPRVLIVSAEQTGVFFTGGLGHATSGLAEGLKAGGINVEIIMPHYTTLKKTLGGIKKTTSTYTVNLNRSGDRWLEAATFQKNIFINPTTGVKTVLFEHKAYNETQNYFENTPPEPGKKVYTNHDQGQAFGAWGKAVSKYILSENFDIVIINDWVGGPIASFIKEAREAGKKTPRVIAAIHNLGYQGLFDMNTFGFIGLKPEHLWGDGPNGFEFYGQINFLKGLLEFSDIAYTVSPTYAKEITTKRFGHGLQGVARRLLSESRLTGILNGISIKEWNPATKYHEVVTETFLPQLSKKN